MKESLILQLINNIKKYYNLETSYSDIENLLKNSEIKNYHAGDILCEVGDTLNKTGLVLNGIARSAFVTYSGKDITRFFHIQYSMILDDCLLGFSESKYRCEIVTDCTIMMFELAFIKDLVKNNPLFHEIYTLSLESGLRYKIYRENELMTKNATERYLQFIQDFPEISKNVKQYDIATYLGIEPQSLSRIRKQLKEHKLEY